MKRFLKEFQTFALRGNVMDLAIGVIIGGAFQRIINSLVNDVITPLLSLFLMTETSDLTVNIGKASVQYGSFISAILDFVIMAFVIFLLVKAINKLRSLGKRNQEEQEFICPYCRSATDERASRCAHCGAEMTPLKKE